MTKTHDKVTGEVEAHRGAAKGAARHVAAHTLGLAPPLLAAAAAAAAAAGVFPIQGVQAM
jgi:hypothetical protein